ncbi:MAG: hypothetical protein ACTHKZ_07455, partial [Lysobacteraceae bacterium]
MNNRNRDDRDSGERNRGAHRQYGAQDDWQDRGHDRFRRHGGRSDRDIQSDFSGGGYDQVGGGRGYASGAYDQPGGGRDDRGGSDWRGGYGREGSYPQSRTLSPDDNRYDSEFGYGSGNRGYSGAGYGQGSAGAGGVGYGAPGYGAGSSYAGANRYRGDFQADRDWLR